VVESTTVARATYAALVRHGAPPEQIAEAKARLTEAVDSKLITEILDGKRLSPRGLERLAVLLRPGPDPPAAQSRDGPDSVRAAPAEEPPETTSRAPSVVGGADKSSRPGGVP
jgi:hypothetical protein